MIVLLGVNHDDSHMGKRLEEKLDMLCPELLTLELRQECVDYAQKHNAALQEFRQRAQQKKMSSELHDIFEQAAKLCEMHVAEWFACAAYATKRKIPLYLIDDPCEIERQREEDFKVIDEIRKDNEDADPEEVHKDIEEAIEAVRKQNPSKNSPRH